MKTVLALLVSLIVLSVSVAAPNPTTTRTFKSIPNFPTESLRVGINRALFRSLSVSPLSAWLMARTSIVNGRAVNAKIIHSEGNGAYDAMVMDIANSYSSKWHDVTESRVQSDTLNVYLLIYDIKDGKMAVSFSHCDDSRYIGYKQSGLAWVGIWNGSKWTTISGKSEGKWGGR